MAFGLFSLGVSGHCFSFFVSLGSDHGTVTLATLLVDVAGPLELPRLYMSVLDELSKSLREATETCQRETNNNLMVEEWGNSGSL